MGRGHVTSGRRMLMEGWLRHCFGIPPFKLGGEIRRNGKKENGSL